MPKHKNICRIDKPGGGALNKMRTGRHKLREFYQATASDRLSLTLRELFASVRDQENFFDSGGSHRTLAEVYNIGEPPRRKPDSDDSASLSSTVERLTETQ